MAISPLTTGALTGVLGLGTDGVLARATFLFIDAAAPGTVGDDGGWEITLTGTFPTDQGITVYVQGGGLKEACYSGVVGQGNLAYSEEGSTLKVAVPPLPEGTYDLYAESEDGLYSGTLAGGLTVVHRAFTTTLYSLRAMFPPPRDVGPYDIRGES